MGCFSFDFGKTITCGEGGMVTFKDEGDFVRGRAFHDHGHEYSDTNEQMISNPQGLNYRMTEVQAAIGMVQLSKLDKILKAQKYNKARLKEKIGAKKFSFRDIVDDSGDIGDSLVLVNDKISPKDLANLIKDYSLPLKTSQTHFVGIMQVLATHTWRKCSKIIKSDTYLLRSVAIPINVFSSSEVEERVVDFFSELKSI